MHAGWPKNFSDIRTTKHTITYYEGTYARKERACTNHSTAEKFFSQLCTQDSWKTFQTNKHRDTKPPHQETHTCAQREAKWQQNRKVFPPYPKAQKRKNFSTKTYRKTRKQKAKKQRKKTNNWAEKHFSHAVQRDGGNVFQLKCTSHDISIISFSSLFA